MTSETKDGEEKDILRATQVYKRTANLLDLCGGWILPCQENSEDSTFRTLWKQTDPAVKESHDYVYKDYTQDGKCGPAVPTTKHGLICQIRGKMSYLHLYNHSEDKKFCLDLWSYNGLVRRYDLSGKDLHGPVYTDTEFSSLSVSQDGSKVVYVAEKKKEKSVSFFAENAKPGEMRGGVYDYAESWGEQLEKCCESVICVLDLDSGELRVLNTPSEVFCAKPAWCGNNTVYLMGLDVTCSKHGAIYCWNRPGYLYSYNLQTNCVVKHTPENKSVYMPSPCHETGKVAFLMCGAGGPHRKYMNVCVFHGDGSGEHEIVRGSSFYGKLSPSPWIDNVHLLLVSYVGTKSVLVKLNVMSGRKENILEGRYGTSSLDVLDQVGSKVLFSVSDFNPDLDKNTRQRVGFIDLDRPDEIKEFWDREQSDKPAINCKYSVRSYVREGREYNGILIEPGAGCLDLKTLIVFPHGGPHSMYTTSFRPDTYNLAQLGFATLLVNYTGSLGLGADNVGLLPGNVGDMDVKDTHHAAVEESAGFQHVAVMGGSHGGFLTAHLIGQYPDFYKAAAMRNPVTDISSMVGVSDIPDWCYCEAGLDYSVHHPPTPTSTDVSTMFEKSPIRYIDQVKCPVLMLIGAKDLRVPPSQGVRYVKYLNSRGVTCSLKMYPEDCHPLGSVPCAGDSLVHVYLWFIKHLNLSTS